MKTWNWLKAVKVTTVEDYFKLPKKEREMWGIYRMPLALPWNLLDDTQDGWEQWKVESCKQYPIQGFIRERFFSFENPVYTFYYTAKRHINDCYYNIKRFINPCCKRFRNAYPRHAYQDISYTIPKVNFALVLDFWHDEVIDGFVDWEANEAHKEFYTWLKNAVHYIEVERINIQNEIDREHSKAYENRKLKLSYEELYGKVNELEKLLERKDTEFLVEIVKRREWFWT